MRRLPLFVALAGLFASPAFAQSTYPTPAGTRVQGVVNLVCDASGANCAPAGTAAAGADKVQGNTASDATDAGNPVKIGGVVNTTTPTSATTGQRKDLWLSNTGAPIISLAGNNPADAIPNTVVGYLTQPAGGGGIPATAGYIYNGASWDRQRGDVTGLWLGGHAALNTGQVSVGTTSTLIAAARAGRQKIVLIQGAANQCAFGNNGVTTATGLAPAPVAGTSITLDTAAAIYGACSVATAVSFMEQY